MRHGCVKKTTLSLLDHCTRANFVVFGDGARLYLLRGGFVPSVRELESAGGFVLLFYISG